MILNKVKDMQSSNKKVVFRDEITLIELELRGRVCLSIEELGIISFGLNKESAINELIEEISFLNEDYCNESDFNLTIDGRELKENTKKIIETIIEYV